MMTRKRDAVADLADPRLTRVARAIMAVLLAPRNNKPFGELNWDEILARHLAGDDDVSVFFDAAEAAMRAGYDA
jgi:hypothetical protein